MKTFKFISLCALAILLFNCSKNDDNIVNDDDSIAELETLIIGDWKIDSRTLNGEAVELDCLNGLSTIVSFDDPVFSFDVDFDDGNGCADVPYSGNYSIDGNMIVINTPFSDDPSIWTVLNIDDTSFERISTSSDGNVTINTYQRI
ncbi:lipocalin family protein [Psychroserpens sp. Hel_I_66]|uniref:lipocalin family protein n=1 Tax=Psychroserpens sp. Hel_I_66 TaxID=1250004 RepID=UPI000648D1F9|nr:lipocalin family protein [Psychroserpens sp. Hel_I_66]